MAEHALFSLDGYRTIVTGASRGIGRAIALGFAEAGADVALVSRKRETLEDVAHEVESRGRQALVLPCHMGKRDEIDRMIDAAIWKWGHIDVLVNNAGTNPVMGPLSGTEEAAWDKVMDVNLKGPLFASAKVGRLMAERGRGSIINMSSTASLEPMPLLGAYSISKAALNSLTRVLARELGPSGVRVNAIAPGLIDTHFSAALMTTPAIYQAVVSRAALGRHGVPEDLIGLAVYLASNAAAYVTGQVFVVDGGTLA
jgi:NAD(P)-dependent dehydrogenase (short-subunit alcohol dehydrogenase family)